jgi:hypothetical protein
VNELSTTPGGEIYLPLMQRLTKMSPNWGLWKNADRALAGHGDVDSVAPTREWNSIVAETRHWAAEHGLSPVAVCHEIPSVMIIIAIDKDRRTFFELDVQARKYWRAWTMFKAKDLLPLFHMDERGFREVRPGVEGVIVFVQNGTRWGGRSNMEGSKIENALELLREDPEGVEQAARLFGPARKSLLSAIEAALHGEWDRAAMLRVEGRSVAGAFLEPHLLAGRVKARFVKKRCPLLRSIFSDDRRLPADADAWIERVDVKHPVFVDF